MLDKIEFNKIRKEMEEFDEKRERFIQRSREIIKLSKQIIYAAHRDDLKDATGLVMDIKKRKKELDNISKVPLDTEIGNVAVQEYAEALCYYNFVKNREIPTRKELDVDTESYLLGLCDLTGELGRKAVADIIQKKFKQALLIKELVDEIYGEFLKFNLRNSELRKKSDQIKWNLKKLEDIIFDVKIKGKLE
ncbi:hypothetical protein J4209_04890 [Candidatus Woesearchaeota archaeon]|nr:hypothetical protein [Candidatus Woesearchaeota archaeon]